MSSERVVRARTYCGDGPLFEADFGWAGNDHRFGNVLLREAFRQIIRDRGHLVRRDVRSVGDHAFQHQLPVLACVTGASDHARGMAGGTGVLHQSLDASRRERLFALGEKSARENDGDEERRAKHGHLLMLERHSTTILIFHSASAECPGSAQWRAPVRCFPERP